MMYQYSAQMYQYMSQIMGGTWFFGNGLWFMGFLALWTVPWKGVALWKAAKNNDKGWFVVLLLLNTAAILEILYIYVFSKKNGK